MTDAAKQLSAAAMNLLPGDRVELVEQLLDSLDVPDAAIDRLWAKEAEDRLAAFRRGELAAMPLAVALAKHNRS
ncbi:MAG: addiction module protein [Rhodospirillaceae bacterium]|nr:addiction module protein [Rhodospirillaceae bacterium]